MNYSIGEFSKITKLSIYTLRYYEQEQLIKPNRKSNGHRYYSDNDILWVEFIQRLKDTNMRIKDIQKYAKLRAIGESTLKVRMDLLIDHRAALQAQINSLNEHMEKLDDKIQYYKTELDNQTTDNNR
jgi:DNA-binding transcriptional MerR regulator